MNLLRPMKEPYIRRSTAPLALGAGFTLVLSGLGLAVALAQDPATNAPPWVAPARAARKENPVPSDEKSRALGKELFVGACLPCHGPAGRGDGPAAATLERKPGNLSDPKLWQQSDGALFWKISEGNSPMPSFQEGFSEEQRWQIVNYVRTLAPQHNQQHQTANSGGH